MTKRTETSRDVERSPGSFVALPPFTGIGVTTTGQVGRVSANCTTIGGRRTTGASDLG